MSNAIALKTIQSFRDDVNNNDKVKLARNASIRSEVIELTMDWDHFRKIDHTFSEVISGEMPATNQKSSGRCWGFAGLNLLRLAVCEKYNLENFEFSQNYFMFCDKLEKANYFLENIIATLDESYDSRLMMWLVSEPIQDGGQWDMFVNLIVKYGAIPQTSMPESFQSSQSYMMNRLITRKLRENASTLRDNYFNGAIITELRKQKEEMMAVVYKMLCICLGTLPESFNWQIRDKKKKFRRFNNLTPLDFYNKHVDIVLTEKVCLIHCPMSNKDMKEHYTVSYLGNVMGGQDISYANVEVDVMKKAAAAKKIFLLCMATVRVVQGWARG